MKLEKMLKEHPWVSAAILACGSFIGVDKVEAQTPPTAPNVTYNKQERSPETAALLITDKTVADQYNLRVEKPIDFMRHLNWSAK